MATYYVSTAGSDSNNGLGADASHATNKPFLTVGKLINTSGVMGNGDTAYISPGVFRQILSINVTTPTVETKILGDPMNLQGFKDGAGVPLARGDVIFSAFLTNDLTAPSSSFLLTFGAHNFFTFENITFVGGTVGVLTYGAGVVPKSIILRRCTLWSMAHGAGNVILLTVGANVIPAWTIDQCLFLVPASVSGFRIDPATSATADYDMACVIKNSVFLLMGSSFGIRSIPSGAAAFKGGGLRVDNCLFLGGTQAVLTSANWSTTYPILVYNSVIAGQSSAALNGSALGQIVEDYNIISAATPRTNVSVGTHSVAGNPPANAALMEIGQSLLYGRGARPFGSPTLGSPLLAFGAQAGGPSVDQLGIAHPGTPAVGPYELPSVFALLGKGRVMGGG